MYSDFLIILLEDEKMKLYIYFDRITEIYSICGKAKEIDFINYEPFYYSYEKKDKKKLYLFIEFVMDIRINVYLYNYNDLSSGYNKINYHLLEELNKEEKIINYYTEQVYNYKYINSLLNIL